MRADLPAHYLYLPESSFISTGFLTISEDQKLLLLIGTIFLIATVAFWPLMTVFVWAIALASALMPFHKRFLKYMPTREKAAVGEESS
ncbi:hypothetical protein [Methanofollis sp. UBA420]|jgi:predicted PurR-regulated permease PerM|uniref:hypothetical protein n=1 Tax=Methanofollis sp. UBA420 TaxID=1915514 RepID=UPI00316AD667